MSDYKTSLLVNKQVPEFIRDEYPVFVSFLEAYYQFLETQQGSQKNDLVSKSKDLRNITDVDASIDDFEDNFFNTFASLIPHQTQVDKAFLIKNVLPIYLAKGNEKSFKLLFRMLFGDEVDIILPKNNVLRASDGKWTVDNILKIQTNIRTLYTGNGSNTLFILAQVAGAGEIDVYVDDVSQIINTDYEIRKETREVIFNSAPAANSEIKIYYNNFDITALNNRKIVGSSSGSSALINRATKRIITDRLNFGLPYELFIDSKSLAGSFTNGEKITTDVIDDNGVVINLEADTYSILTGIEVTAGGSSYNVGDPVLVLGGGANPPATAIVSEVSAGVIDGYLTVNYGGAGFKISGYANSYGTPSNTIVIGTINTVNTGHFSNSTYRVTDDVISSYGSVLINAADYGFPGPFTENVNTRLVDALTPLFVTNLGPITNVGVYFSNVTSNISTFDSQGAAYTAGSNSFDIKTFNSVGRIDVTNSGGSSYKVGDEIIFDVNPPGTYGIDAAAYVATVNATGAILTVNIGPPHITGTVALTNNSSTITGTGTTFLSDLKLGDMIQVAGQYRYIGTLTSDTSAASNVAFSFNDGTTSTSGRKLGNYNRNQLGGVNYTQDNFPNVSVSTVSGGSGATVAITSLMGNGEKLTGNTNSVIGAVTKISLASGGSGYEYIPQVDLTAHGDGLATANAILGDAYSSLPGRWTTSDSILSSIERKLAGKNYYTDYAYVTSSVTEFSKYKQILKNLLHPAGFVNYADLNKETNILVEDSNISTNIAVSLSGTVNLNSSIYVIGTGTKFNIANGNTISIGTGNPRSNISVNGEIRLISNIISNTVLRVSSAFSNTVTGQTIIVVANA